MSKWEIFKIGDVCKTSSGGTPLKLNNDYYDNGDIPWLVSGEVCQKNILNNKNYITQKGLENSSAKLFPVNTVLVAMYGATAGQVGILRFESATNQAICGILPNKRIIPEFLYYALLFKKSELIAQATGNAQPNISQIKIKNTKIPVPPIEEQKRIVEILDKAFEGIAQAEANTRRNLINARELFDSCLDNIFIEKGDNWIESILSQVCQFENGDRGKNYPNREEYVKSGIPWINTGHIQPDGTLSQSEMNFISREKYETLRGGKIQPGDLVYCLRGATIGKTALVDPLSIGAIASSLVILRPNKSLDSKFLYYFLISSPARKQIKLYDNGAAQPNLGAKSVAKYIIYFPEFSEQKNIVKKLDILAEETKKLETIYQRKLEAIAELKQSILEKAFTGQLSQ